MSGPSRSLSPPRACGRAAVRAPASRLGHAAARAGRTPAEPAGARATGATSAGDAHPGCSGAGRSCSRACSRAVLATIAMAQIGVGRVARGAWSHQSRGWWPLRWAAMCASMFARAIAWHAILACAPDVARARRRDAMQGTFIGVLMSSTLPARLGEPSRALIVARRLGRARETLPVVLGTMVSQTMLNLLALSLLGAAMFSCVNVLDGHHGALIARRARPAAPRWPRCSSPRCCCRGSFARRAQSAGAALLLALRADARGACATGCASFAIPARAMARRAFSRCLGTAAGQLLAAADGFRARGPRGLAGAAAVLFAVNVTAVLPATPANVGVFQAACAAVLVGAYHVSAPEAIAYGIVLQAVEVATALIMGMPALVGEGLSWRDVRLRAMPPRRCSCRRCRRAPTGARRAPPRRGLAEGPPPRGDRPSMTDAWVYMLRCADGSLYTGWSSDLARRLARHQRRDGEQVHRQSPAGRARDGRGDARSQRRDARGGTHQEARQGLEAGPDRGRGDVPARRGQDGRRGGEARLSHDGGMATRPPGEA